MNLSLFVARRVAFSGQKSFAKLIIRIATGAVALSVAVMIVAIALIKGFKTEISDKMFSFWGHIHITSTSVSTTLEATPISKTQPFYTHLPKLKPIAGSQGGIKHIQIYATKAGIIKTKTAFEGIVLKGIGADYDFQYLKKNLRAGEVLDTKKTYDESEQPNMMISQSTADRLNLKTGSRFVVHFVKGNEQQQKVFRVVGIYKTGLEEYDKQFAIVDIRVIQELLGWQADQVQGFEVFLENIKDINVWNDYIYNKVISNDLYSVTIQEEQPNIFQWLDLQNINEQIILLLMLIVSVINMVTALLILILERTNMIGTLKALGSRNWAIQKIFLYYGAIIALSGLLLGNIIGLSLCFLQKQFAIIQLSEKDYYLAVAPIKVDIWTVVLLNVGSLGVIVFCLLFPTFLITRISPVQAIKFK